MRKYRFTNEQRFALWRVYERKCFYCEQPLTFRETTIDHVLPESLLDKPDELSTIKTEYGLAAEFGINDYCNWAPAHQHCNRNKGSFVSSKTPAFIKILETVQRKGKRAQLEEKRIVDNLKKGELLGKLGIALKKGILSLAEVNGFLNETSPKRDEYEPVVIAFGARIDELPGEGIPDNVSRDYISLCDWLEQDLINQLGTLLSCSFYYPEPSQRTGETLSVRFAFLQLDLGELDKFKSPYWEITEIQYYSEVYGASDWTQERYRQNIGNAPVIDDSEFIELLHRGGLLTHFRQVVGNDYRAVAMSQDYSLYQSDSYYDLEMWRQIFELAGVEEWEIEQAMAKSK